MVRLLVIASLLQISLLAGVSKIDISSTSHNLGVSSNLNNVIFNWSKPETTDGDIISKYRWKFDNNSSSDLENDKDANEVSVSSNSLTLSLVGKNDGDWYFHIMAITELGDSGVDNIFGKIVVDRTAPTVSIINKTLDSKAVEISLKSPDNSAKIYYSVDGKVPTNQSQLYDRPFTIYSTKVVKFIGIDLTKNSSKVFEKSITVNYSGNIVKFINITDNLKISTKSINGASSINPQISVSASALQSYRYRFDSNKYSNLIDKDKSIDTTKLLEGLHTLYVKGVDNIGNVQIEDSVLHFTIDNSPPKYIKGYIDNQVLGERNIFSESKVLTLSTDEVSTIRYTVDGDTPTKTFGSIYDGSIQINNNKNLKLIAYDSLGNICQVKSLNIVIDREKPTIPKIFDSNMNELDSSNIAFYKDKYLYNQTRIFNFTSSDNLTPNPNIYWTLDGKTPTLLNSNSGNVSVQSTSTLKFIAVDEVNNSTDVQNIDFLIDKTAPKSLSFTVSNSCVNKNNIYNCINSKIDIRLDAIDNETPNDLKIYYTQNGELPNRDSLNIDNGKSVNLNLTKNEKTFKFVAYDKVGNRSETKNVKLRYDIENVEQTLQIILSLSLENNSSINSNNLKKIGVTISNGGDKVIYYYKINSSNYSIESNISKSIDISNLTDGSYILDVVASNGEINSTKNSINFKVDNTAPNKPVISGESEFNISTTINITGSDNSSKIYYSTNGATPSTESLEYNSPITISETVKIRAFSIDSVGNRSGESTKTFIKKIVEHIVSDSDKSQNSENPNSNEDSNLTQQDNQDNNSSETPKDDNKNSENNQSTNNSDSKEELDKSFNNANIISNQMIRDESGREVGESLIIENSVGDSKSVELYYPKDITISDDGNKTYIYSNQNISQTTKVFQNGSVSSKIIENGNMIKVNSDLTSQTINILESGDILIKSGDIVSDSGKSSKIEIKASLKQVEIKLYSNGNLIDFPIVDLNEESADIDISLKSDNSINIELNIPLSFKNLIF